MVCPSCSSIISDASKFCSECGERILRSFLSQILSDTEPWAVHGKQIEISYQPIDLEDPKSKGMFFGVQYADRFYYLKQDESFAIYIALKCEGDLRSVLTDKDLLQLNNDFRLSNFWLVDDGTLFLAHALPLVPELGVSVAKKQLLICLISIDSAVDKMQEKLNGTPTSETDSTPTTNPSPSGRLEKGLNMIAQTIALGDALVANYRNARNEMQNRQQPVIEYQKEGSSSHRHNQTGTSSQQTDPDRPTWLADK